MNVQNYLDYVNSPWGRLFYQLAWRHIDFSGKKILDFGSGFGVTANHLAKMNDVVAIEPNVECLEHRFCDHEYTQITGGLEQLKKITDNSLDVIICHNVLEYVDDRQLLLNEFFRILRGGGILSVIKHNRNGKILHKAVFENNIADAMMLINNENIISQNFGVIHEYRLCDLEKLCRNLFQIRSVYGIRTFYGLQKNEFKTGENWLSDMYEIECAVESAETFRDIAFFHHVILQK